MQNPNSEIKIMIVEDEFVTASGLKISLEELGYSVSARVASGEEAVKKAEEDKPDLVLMDIELSGKMDGVETAGTIHSRFEIPSIFITAYADDNLLGRAKITEPFGYILKPFEKRELYSNIEMALYKHRAEMELKKLNQELLEKEELKATMAMAVTACHEINSPLTSVIGFVEYLQSEKDLSEEEKEKTLNVIHKEASRISNFLKRFSKIAKPVKKKYIGDTDMIDLEKSKYKEW